MPTRASDSPEARARLPRWAQDRLTQLEGTVEYFKGKLREGPADSVIWMNNMPDRQDWGGAPARPMGDDSVYFKLDSGWIQCDVRWGKLNIHAYNGMLSLEPQSGNVANATVRDR